MNDIIIFSARIARDLIQNNYTLNDIQPDNKYKIKTIFYFKDTIQLRDYLKKKHNIEIQTSHNSLECVNYLVSIT